jgi:hypothetical protein
MANLKKYFLPITIGIAGLIYLVKSLKKPESVLNKDGSVDTKKSGTISSTPVKPSAPLPISAYRYPLKKGNNGAFVGLLQQALGGKKNLPKYGIDNDFGSETETAVFKFLGKKTVDNQADIEKIASLNGLVFSNGQYVPKLISAPSSTGLVLSDLTKPFTL